MLISDDENLQIGARDRLLIKKINEDPDFFRDITIVEFAKRAETSTSAISKFIRKLHFEGYRDFQNHLNRQKINSETAKRISLENNALIIKDQNLGIKNCDHYFLSKTINSFDYPAFIELINLLEKAQRIWIIGYENSYLAALDLTNSLINLGKTAFATHSTNQILLQSNFLTNQDLVILIAENWRITNYHEIVRVLKEKNISNGAITGMNRFFMPNTDCVVNFYIPLSKKTRPPLYNSKMQELFINNLIIQVLSKRIVKT